MQELFGVVVVWSVLMTGVSFFCLIRLGRYRRQIRHMVEELSMMQQEDTDHRLSSCCRAGRTQEVILLMNQIVGRYRSERVLLRRENRAYRESITSISHDIRTPLTSAKGYLQMLSEGTRSDPASVNKCREYIAAVERRVDDVTDLLNQLFEYTRIEAGSMAFSMERINLTNLFADTVSMFYDDFVKKGCEPVVDIPQTPCYVLADRHALVRIIENLIRNALVHGTGDYRLALLKQDGAVCLCVSNRTDSIEERDLDRIFDRFYTTDVSRTHKATGLGLAIVRQFAEHMDGRVEASLEGGIFSISVKCSSCISRTDSVDCNKELSGNN